MSDILNMFSKKSTMKFVLLFCFTGLLVHNVFTQNTSISPDMSSAMGMAEIIVEGEVVGEAVVSKDDDGLISTFTIRVINSLKSDIQKGFIEVIIRGGVTDDLIQTSAHGGSLKRGEYGIFLLHFIGNRQRLALLNGNYGKITPLKYDYEHGAIWWGEVEKHKSWRQLKETIGNYLGHDLTIKPLNLTFSESSASDKELCVKIANPKPNYEDKSVEFDVLAKSSVAGLKFGRAEVLINYPEGNLGEFIVQQEKIEAEKSDMTNGDAYTVEVLDQTKNQINLSIDSDCNGEDPHYVLDTAYEKLAKITVFVEEWGDLGEMSVEEFGVSGTAEYLVPNSFNGSTDGCDDFDFLCGDTDGSFNFKACSMLAYEGSIFNAGINETITFTGEDLGLPSTAEIAIPRANSGGTSRLLFKADREDIIDNWSSTTITAKVLNKMAGSPGSPESASSGLWQIFPEGFDGVRLPCETSVEVGYSISGGVIGPDDLTEQRNIFPIAGLQNRFGYPQTTALEVYVDGASIANAFSVNDLAEFEEIVQAVICEWEKTGAVEIIIMGLPHHQQEIL